MTDTARPIIRPVLETDAAALAVLSGRLAESDPYLVVSGFDPASGAMLTRPPSTDIAATGPSEIFVAEIGAEFAGFAICRRHPPPERDTILQLDLGVDTAYRRRGVATALVQHAVEWARETGIHRIQLSVVAENEPAILLYKKHGFVIEGTLKKGFRLAGDFHDVHVMATFLT